MSKEKASVLLLTVAFWCLMALAFCGRSDDTQTNPLPVVACRELGRFTGPAFGSVWECDFGVYGKCLMTSHGRGGGITCPSPLVSPSHGVE